MPPRLGPLEFRRIQTLMQRVSGISLADHKLSLVENRLQGRLRELGIGDYQAYLARLDADADERVRVVDSLTTNETHFFREPRHFQVLARIAASAGPRLRVWSAACSSGQEPYSIAMTLADNRRGGPWEVVASDICQSVLEVGRAGVYPERAAAEIPRPQLVRHCLKGVEDMSGWFQIRPALRKRVQFLSLNLMAPLPASLGVFDVVFLRNVLIYFETASKRHIVRQILERIRPGGYLFVGHSETVQGLDLPLDTLAPATYRKKGGRREDWPQGGQDDAWSA